MDTLARQRIEEIEEGSFSIKRKIDDFVDDMELQPAFADLSEDQLSQDEVFSTSGHYEEFFEYVDAHVAVDSMAKPHYLGNTGDNGALRTDTGLRYTDGGNWVTLRHAQTSSSDSLAGGQNEFIRMAVRDTFGHVTDWELATVYIDTSSEIDTRIIDTRIIERINDSAHKLPPGGYKYQQLTKTSDNDYAVDWDWTRAHL